MYIYKDSLLAIPYCSLCTDEHTHTHIPLPQIPHLTSALENHNWQRRRQKRRRRLIFTYIYTLLFIIRNVYVIISCDYLLLLLINIDWPSLGPGPWGRPSEGPGCCQSEGPDWPSAEGSSERAPRMGWGRARARARPMNILNHNM
jgi:hypothetical protein